MIALINYFKGKKTYFFAALLVIYAASGYATHQLSFSQAMGVLLGSGSLASARAALGKVEQMILTVLAILNDLNQQPQQQQPQQPQA